MLSFRHLGVLALAGGLLIPSTGLHSAQAATSLTTITVWSAANDSPSQPTPNGAGYAAIVARYQQLHPNIKINWTEYTPQQDPGSYQTLLTAIAGGKAPDIAMVDRFVAPEFAAKGAVQALDPYLPKNPSMISTDHLMPGAWEELHGFNGSLYGIPVVFDAVGFWSLYYNKTLLSQAGIHPPTTWAELNAAAKKLTQKAGPRITQLGYLPYPDTAGELDSFLYGQNGHIVSSDGKKAQLDNAVAVGALQEFVDVVDAQGGWSAVSRLIPTATTPAAQNPFYLGTAAMTDGGDWYLQSIALYAPNLQFGVVPMPNQAGKNYGGWAGGWSFQLVTGARHPSEAAQFMDYLTSSDAAKTFILGSQAYGQKHNQLVVLPGGLYFAWPALVTQYNLPLLKKYPDVLAGVQSFINVPKKYHATYARDRSVVAGEVWTAEENASENALFHKMTPQQALAQQNGVIQAAIDKFYK